jgi:hypothetical protein
LFVPDSGSAVEKGTLLEVGFARLRLLFGAESKWTECSPNCYSL